MIPFGVSPNENKSITIGLVLHLTLLLGMIQKMSQRCLPL
jgi:hypothetical protein